MNTSTYCFDREQVAGIEELCKRMTGTALQSPFRSTVPLLSLVDHSQPEWHAFLASLGAPPDRTVHFEYRVASPKPSGKASQTDAMLMSESTVFAVEAKWTEPRYETVAKRVRKPEEDGSDPRTTIDGWLNHLRPFATRKVGVDDVLEVVYQVLHRAASACAVATAKQLRPHLVYLHFHPSQLRTSATTSQYLSDLRHLHALLGNPAGITFTVVEMPLTPTAAFDAIAGLNKGARESAAQVKTALCSGPLFTFGTPTITHI